MLLGTLRLNTTTRMKTLLTFALLVCFNTVFAIGGYNVGDELFVHAPSGLKLRPAPNSNDALATLPYGAKLKVVQNKSTANPKEVDGLKGYWAKVEFEGKQGFIFDGYLSFLPTPKAGCNNVKDYCKDFFTSTSKELLQSVSCDNEIMDENTINLYSYKGRQIVYTLNQGYEWGGETLSIENISIEEGYLLSKVLFKADFDRSYDYYKANPNSATIDNIPVDLAPYVMFKTDAENPDCLTINFQSECYDQLNVVQRKGVMVLRRSGGC